MSSHNVALSNDSVTAQALAQRTEIREQVEATNRLVHLRAGALQFVPDMAAEVTQDAPRLHQIALDFQPALEGTDGRILDRRTG